MELSFKVLELEFEFAFAISRGSKSFSKTVLVELTYGSLKAFGEAVFSEFYGEDLNSVIEFYTFVQENNLIKNLDPFKQQEFELIVNKIPGKHQAAKAGLEIALYDLRAKLVNLPLYKYLGLDPKLAPKTSYTIGLADLGTITKKTKTALERGFDILKVKLGSSDDIKIIEKIRSLAPQARIRVDANAAWQIDAALKTLNVIKDFDIEFVEEPLLLNSAEADYQKLFTESPLALMADESCHVLADVPLCAKYFHMINIKHTKSGGLSEAIKMIWAAKAHGMKIMLGCFCETTVSISAFGHISPLVDFADLDGSLLLANDPFKNDLFTKNHIVLRDRPGLGLEL